MLASTAQAREFKHDGVLDDWTPADRLDLVPGFGVTGHQLYGYHDAALGKYHLAIVAPVAIGPASTFWLDTDLDSATGYMLWGAYVGAEANINIAWDGTPHLYTGADGEAWVAGPLSHSFNANHTVLELEVSHGLLGSKGHIRTWMDLNNQTFLPTWFGGGGYVIDDKGVPPAPASPDGPIALDGSLGEWTLQDRIDRLPGMAVLNYEVYGRATADTYYLALRALPPASAIGAGTTFWLNTDLNRATGHQVWGIAVGSEHNVNVAWDGTPHLYTGAAAQNWQIGPLPHARSADGGTIEIALDRALLAAPGQTLPKAIDVSVDVNDAIFLPADFTGPGHRLYHPIDLPPKAGDDALRVGLVFSATSAAAFFGDKAYSQLYAAMQHQAALAGMPFELVHEDALLDIQKVKDFSVLLLPYFANVAADKADVVADVLTRLVYHYGTGVVAVGNLLTNDPHGAALPGDSYARMKRVLGVTLEGYWGPQDHVIRAGAGHAITRGYTDGAELGSYPGGYLLYFKRFFSVADSIAIAEAKLADGSTERRAAIWAVEPAARVVHFASPSIAGDTDLVARALRWVAFGEGVAVGLHPTRFDSVFIGRCDMDQSQYIDEAPTVYAQLMPIVNKWKQTLNMVSSYYINVGDNKGAGEITDWTKSGPIYKSLMALGNEIGTHSYTHPHYTASLTPAQLHYEFAQSRDVIAKQLGVPVQSAAVPGNPETLAVDWELNKWFAYATADYSGTSAGYHGAMGWLTPDYDMVYLAPNLYFDFTIIDFKKLSATEGLALWKQQFDSLTAHARGAFVVWPWHDYGPTAYEGPQYQEFMFTDFLAYARDKGTEFVTGLQAAARLKSLRKAAVHVSPIDADSLFVDVDADDEAGVMALRLDLPPGRRVVSVDGWPAFSDDSVWTGAGPRSYLVRLGDAASSEVRLTTLPMRARLLRVEATPTSFRFKFKGEGEVEVSIPAGVTLSGRCGAAGRVGTRSMAFTFDQDAEHTCELKIEQQLRRRSDRRATQRQR